MDVTLQTAAAVDRDYREASLRLGRATLSLLPESPRILTHCWADAYLFGLVAAAREAAARSSGSRPRRAPTCRVRA